MFLSLADLKVYIGAKEVQKINKKGDSILNNYFIFQILEVSLCYCFRPETPIKVDPLGVQQLTVKICLWGLYEDEIYYLSRINKNMKNN